MLIRNAREDDFNRCVEIAGRAWPAFTERTSIYHLFCKFFSNTSFICEDSSEVHAFLLGFVSQVDPTVGYIHLVAVDPPAQRRGLAERLYRQFFETMKGLGVQTVRLIVNPDNAGSLAFHGKLGFRPDLHGDTIEIDGVVAVRNYNGPGIHMVPFRRDLD